MRQQARNGAVGDASSKEATVATTGESLFALVCSRCSKTLLYVQDNVLVMNSTVIERPESEGAGFDIECWTCGKITAHVGGARLNMCGLDIYTSSQRPEGKPAFLVRNPGPVDGDLMRRLQDQGPST
jgi:hypothetical protein